MAVDDHLPMVAPLSANSNSSSSSSSTTNTHQQYRTQVATDNSSTFIQFPISLRQSSVYVPTYRSRTNLSTAPPTRLTPETSTASNKTKSHTSESSVVSTDRERSLSRQRFNPILNNPLLNHRKEQPKSSSTKVSVDFSQTTRLCLPSKSTQNNHQISSNLTYETENDISHEQLISDEKENNDQQETLPCLDKTKYDYITRWLFNVQQANSSKESITKTRRLKNKFVQS